MKYTLLLTTILLCLGGCASPPTAQEIATADYGTPITKAQAVTTAERVIRNTLKDPNSAQFNWVSFGKGYVTEPHIGGSNIYGYKLAGTVNARNSFGGYTGRKRFIFIYHGTTLFAVWAQTDHYLVRVK